MAGELADPLALFEKLLAGAQTLRERAARLRAAARALLLHVNATSAAARDLVDDARRAARLDRARTFIATNVSLSSHAKDALVAVFSQKARTDHGEAWLAASSALSEDVDPSVVLEELVKADLVKDPLLARGGSKTNMKADRYANRGRAAPKVLELTPAGEAALGEELDALELRHANALEAAPWPRVARRVAAARAGAYLVAKALAGKVLGGCREKTALAEELLRQARDAAVEANFTIRTLEKPLGEVSKRAYALHNAFDTLTDATNREFYDKPCRPVFGACCVRDAPDGGMRITCGS